MSDIPKEKVEEAAREYVEALDAYHKLVNEYVSVFGPGETSFKPKVLTRENLDELAEANVKVTEAQKRWLQLYRGLSNAKR